MMTRAAYQVTPDLLNLPNLILIVPLRSSDIPQLPAVPHLLATPRWEARPAKKDYHVQWDPLRYRK